MSIAVKVFFSRFFDAINKTPYCYSDMDILKLDLRNIRAKVPYERIKIAAVDGAVFFGPKLLFCHVDIEDSNGDLNKLINEFNDQMRIDGVSQCFFARFQIYDTLVSDVLTQCRDMYIDWSDKGGIQVRFLDGAFDCDNLVKSFPNLDNSECRNLCGLINEINRQPAPIHQILAVVKDFKALGHILKSKQRFTKADLFEFKYHTPQ